MKSLKQTLLKLQFEITSEGFIITTTHIEKNPNTSQKT